MALTLRSTKGSELTHAEADANFSGLADGSLITIDRNLTGGSTSTLANWHANQVINVKTDFGAVGDGVTDDTAAIKEAIAGMSNNGVLLFPYGTYLCGSQIVSGTVLPLGIRFLAIGQDGGASSVNGTVLKYTGSSICWDIRHGTSDNRGQWTWEGFTFQCTDNAGGMFQFNDITAGIATVQFLHGIRFIDCKAEGANGGASQTGNFIQGIKCFHLLMDDTCYVRNWKRGVYLKQCDNSVIRARFSGNRRHIQLESASSFGNDNKIDSRYVGTVASAGSETAYQIYDQANHTQIFSPDLESGGVSMTAHIYIDGQNGVIIAPEFGSTSSPMFELGASASEYVCIRPLYTSTTTKTNVYATASGYEPFTNDLFIGLTIVNPDVRSEKYALTPHPRLRVIGPLGYKTSIKNQSSLIATANGVSQKRFSITPLDYWGSRSVKGAISGIVSDTGGYFDYAIETTTTNNSGFGMELVVGKDIENGDTAKVTLWYRMDQVPTTGTIRYQVLKNSSNVTNAAITNTTTYARFSYAYTLSGFSSGDVIDFMNYNAASDAKLLVAAMIVEVCDPANADTSGATLAALETEVNELKATMRKFGLLAD